jgi:competence protein ComEA
MKNSIKEYFTFSRSQQRGIILLLILIGVTLIAPKLYIHYTRKAIKPNLSFFDSVLVENQKPVIEKKQLLTDSLFRFDPNKATYNDFIRLGLSEKLTHTIIKYRNAGGKFNQPSDLSKIYGFPDSLFKQIQPFIDIRISNKYIKKEESVYKDNTHNKTTNNEKVNNKILTIYELNTVDSIQLVSLPGIGPVIAKRIISYRQFLGGFYSVNQLMEVYKMPLETYEALRSRFTVDTAFITKINLNQVDFNRLSKHPYLSYANTKALLSFKKTMGQFKSPNELIKYHLVDTITYQKLQPYLDTR